MYPAAGLAGTAGTADASPFRFFAECSRPSAKKPSSTSFSQHPSCSRSVEGLPITPSIPIDYHNGHGSAHSSSYSFSINSCDDSDARQIHMQAVLAEHRDFVFFTRLVIGISKGGIIQGGKNGSGAEEQEESLWMQEKRRECLLSILKTRNSENPKARSLAPHSLLTIKSQHKRVPDTRNTQTGHSMACYYPSTGHLDCFIYDRDHRPYVEFLEEEQIFEMDW